MSNIYIYIYDDDDDDDDFYNDGCMYLSVHLCI